MLAPGRDTMARSGPKKPRPRPRKRAGGGARVRRAVAERPARKSLPAVEMALAALAHDIRTPLTGILALAELLAASDIGARERGWAQSIRSAAEHLAQLTTVVTDAAKADAARLVLRRETFSPRAFTEAIGAALIARAQTIGLKADVVVAPDLPQCVIGDAVRLRAALENLIDNAVKFTAQGSVALTLRAQPLPRGRVKLLFDVTDSGIGLRESEIRKLFRPFAQASAEVSRRYGGTGLGLTLVKRLAKAMGGDLKVTSKLAEGSTFHLSVVVDAVFAEAEQDGARCADDARAGAALNILCVEDNAYSRVVLSTLLAELGHRADFAGTGEAALAALARGGYDCVLMDVTLSGMDGFETTRRIRALGDGKGDIPIIGISAHASAEDEARARAAGMNAYLVKPVSAPALVHAIGRIKTGRSRRRLLLHD
jgi:CheY-like chemotaxis protein